MAKKRQRSAYQREREALIKRAKRKGYSLDIPTQAQQLQSGRSKTDLGREAKQLHKLRGNKLETYVEEGGEYNKKYFWQVSSSEGQMRNKNTGKVMYDLISPDKGTQWYKIDPNTGEIEYDNIDIFTGRVEGSVDPNKSDAQLEKEYEEAEEKYPPTPSYNVEPDPASSISDYLWDNDWGYDEEDDDSEQDTLFYKSEDDNLYEYDEGNNEAADYHDYTDYEEHIDAEDNGHLGIDKNRKLKPKMSYDEIMQALDGDSYTPKEKDEFEKALEYARQSKANIEEILESYHGPKFVVINPGSHTGYYVNDDETISKLKAILNESFSNSTNTVKGCYAWANYMDLMSSDLQTIIDSADSNYQDNDYADMLADIGTIMNNGRPLDPDVGMDLISEINTYDDYEEGW